MVFYNTDDTVRIIKTADNTRIIFLRYDLTSGLLTGASANDDMGHVQKTIRYTYSSGTPTLSTVTTDGETGGPNQVFYWTTDNYLTYVGAGVAAASVGYRYTTPSSGPSMVSRIQTPQGTIAYRYASVTPLTCPAGANTEIFFNYQGECGTDGSCPAGSQCESGACFASDRCLTVMRPNEDLVTDVTASCGSCLSTKHYEWSTANSTIELRGTLSPLSIKTSYAYNNNGRLTDIVENDSDYVATNTDPAGARRTYYNYGSTFPGLATEVGQQSALVNTPCSRSAPTGCKRSTIQYLTGTSA